MKPGHTAGLVRADNRANIPSKLQPDAEPSHARVILKARGERNNAIPFINPIHSPPPTLPRKDFGLKPFVCALHDGACAPVLVRRLHARRVNKRNGSIQPRHDPLPERLFSAVAFLHKS